MYNELYIGPAQMGFRRALYPTGDGALESICNFSSDDFSFPWHRPTSCTKAAACRIEARIDSELTVARPPPIDASRCCC